LDSGPLPRYPVLVTIFSLIQIEPAGGLSQALSSSPVLALAAMFGAGLLTSLTPCVYPMIPITAAVIAGTSREDQPKSRTVGLTLTYAVGLATVYALLGAIAGLTGQLFGTVSASPWARLAIGNLLVLFALPALSLAEDDWKWGEIPREELFATHFPEAPHASAVVLLDHLTIRVDSKQRVKLDRHHRTRIMKEADKEEIELVRRFLQVLQEKIERRRDATL